MRFNCIEAREWIKGDDRYRDVFVALVASAAEQRQVVVAAVDLIVLAEHSLRGPRAIQRSLSDDRGAGLALLGQR